MCGERRRRRRRRGVAHAAEQSVQLDEDEERALKARLGDGRCS